jgi:hypothetical protein
LRRAFIAILAGIALLFTGSMAFIVWATSDGTRAVVAPLAPASPDSARGSDGAAPAALAAAAAPGSEDPGSAPPAPIAGPQVAAFAAPETPPADGIHRPPERMPAPRRKALRDFRLEMKAGLAELRMRVEACSLAAASLSLDVESVEGGVRVVNAVVESAGGASPADVACAQKALRGHVIPAASVEPGRRWRMPFAVHSST